MKQSAASLLLLLAAASLVASVAAAARPLPTAGAGVGRRALAQLPSGVGPAATTTYSVEWDLAFGALCSSPCALLPPALC
jgi:hypothetical protein